MKLAKQENKLISKEIICYFIYLRAVLNLIKQVKSSVFDTTTITTNGSLLNDTLSTSPIMYKKILSKNDKDIS